MGISRGLIDGPGRQAAWHRCLADGWTVSDDLKNVVISLLQGVRCHDGWEFTRCENYLRAHRQHAGGVVSVGGAHHHTIDFQFDWRGRPGQPALRPRLWVGLPSEAGGSMTAGTNDAAAASIDIARL